MTATDYIQTILQIKKEEDTAQSINESTAYEAAQLISGSFTYPLYEELWKNFFEMDEITSRLENLYDSGNHFGVVYFVFILANAVDYSIPVEFAEMSAKTVFVPYLSAAIIDDWLDYDGSCEATEYDG